METLTLSEIILSDTIPEIHPHWRALKTNCIQNQQAQAQVTDSKLQTTRDSLLTVDKGTSADPVTKDQPSQAITPCLLPSSANFHNPVQQYNSEMTSLKQNTHG